LTAVHRNGCRRDWRTQSLESARLANVIVEARNKLRSPAARFQVHRIVVWVPMFGAFDDRPGCLFLGCCRRNLNISRVLRSYGYVNTGGSRSTHGHPRMKCLPTSCVNVINSIPPCSPNARWAHGPQTIRSSRPIRFQAARCRRSVGAWAKIGMSHSAQWPVHSSPKSDGGNSRRRLASMPA